jgi:hypothetical protein
VAINLTKEQAIKAVNLSKVSLQKIVDNKAIPTNMRVCVFLDRSGSMRERYEQNVVLEVLRRTLPLALLFDDNEKIDFGYFHNEAKWLVDVDMNNFYDYQKNYIDRIMYGGTCYHKIFELVYDRYVLSEPSHIPVYLLIITDGDTENKIETTKWIMQLSYYNIFIKFLCIPTYGDGFEYLEKLDNLKPQYRFVDNVDSKVIIDLSNTTNDKLNNDLIDELDVWMEAFNGTPKKECPDVLRVPDLMHGGHEEYSTQFISTYQSRGNGAVKKGFFTNVMNKLKGN